MCEDEERRFRFRIEHGQTVDAMEAEESRRVQQTAKQQLLSQYFSNVPVKELPVWKSQTQCDV